MNEHPHEEAFVNAKRQTTELFLKAMDTTAASATSLDKTLVSLAGGTLMFSMAFVEKLAPLKHFLWLLFLCWVAFAASILGVIVGMRLSQIESGRCVERLANLIKELDCKRAEIPPVKPELSLRSYFSRPTRISNWCAIGAFLVGLILLGVFVALNLIA